MFSVIYFCQGYSDLSNMDPIGPGNHERAWNDPPKFAFNSGGPAGSGNPSGRRRLLNKRVPVPTGPQAGGSPLPPSMKPGDGPPVGSPPTGSSIHGPPVAGPPTDAQLCERTCASVKPDMSPLADNRSSEEKLKDVEKSFYLAFEKVSDHLKENVKEEILKRYEVMKTMWQEGKLNDVVQNRMVSLTKALAEENFDGAWSIHQGLIVDFTSMCSPWMLGFKTLVIECRNQAKVRSDPDTDKQVVEDVPSGVLMLSPKDISKIVINDSRDDPDSEADVKGEK